MRHVTLILATLLISVSAQAETSRGLIKVASSEATQQVQPATPTKPAVVAEAAKADAPKTETTKADMAQADEKAAAKPTKTQTVRKRETGEQKARRIAARYGVYW